MLQITNLHAEINGKKILKGLNLTVNKGEIHAIMGPNGAGKSTLSAVIAGREGYEITEGTIVFRGNDIVEMAPDERAKAGIFLAFQYPIEIPGVSNANFLKASIAAHRTYNELPQLTPAEFLKLMREKAHLVGLDNKLISRSVNEGFSGGEKKRNEIFQLAMLNPHLAILDETDSGLDIDALKAVAHGVNTLKNADNAFMIITHYQRLLDYIIPDFVHVLYDGQIVKTGDKSLALDLEARGYDWIKQEMTA